MKRAVAAALLAAALVLLCVPCTADTAYNLIRIGRYAGKSGTGTFRLNDNTYSVTWDRGSGSVTILTADAATWSTMRTTPVFPYGTEFIVEDESVAEVLYRTAPSWIAVPYSASLWESPSSGAPGSDWYTLSEAGAEQGSQGDVTTGVQGGQVLTTVRNIAGVKTVYFRKYDVNKLRMATPSPPAVALAHAGAGLVTSGAHTYKVTLVTASGETTAGSASASVTTATATNGKVALSAIPTGAAGTTARKIYRTEAGGSTYKLLTTIANNTTTTYTDNTPDASLGAEPPLTNGSGENNPSNVTTTALTTLGAGLVTSGAHAYKVTLTSAAGETTAGGASGSVTTVEATCGKVELTGIPTGGAGTLSRKVYRTEAGGATYKLLTTISDNVTTTYSDNLADASLGAEPPGANTTGLTDPAATPADDLANLGAGLVTSGAHTYKVTFYTAIGESLPTSNASGSVTTATATNGKVDLSVIPTGAAGTVGRKIYRTEAGGADYKLLATIADNTTATYRDNIADGSLGAAVPIANTTAIADPVDTCTATKAGVAGNITNGTHSWKWTYVTAVGETAPSAKSNVVTIIDSGTDGQVGLTGITVGPSGTTARKVYRTAAGDAGAWKLVGTISDNVTTTFTDNVADGSLGADVGANTTELADPGATAPTAALWNGGAGNLDNAAYNYKVTFVNLAGETLGSAASGGALVADNTVNGQVALSDIPLGGTGCTARKLYRTEGGGADYKLLATINDNTTTVYTDNIADGSLGAAEPVANTTALAAPAAATAALTTLGNGSVDAGAHDYSVSFVTATGETDDTPVSAAVTTTACAGKVELTTIPTGGSGTTARKIYRTEAGAGTYKLLTTISDNSTTVYTDNTADSALGAAAPSSNTTQIPAPGAATAALANLGAGNVDNGTHVYRTICTTGCEDSLASDDASVTVADNTVDGQVSVTVPVSTSSRCTSRAVYRSTDSGATFYLVDTIADNVTTAYTDNKANGSLGIQLPEAYYDE